MTAADPPEAPRLTVAVATRDRPARLAAMFAGLARQDVDPAALEVVVCDDGSGPGTRRVLDRIRDGPLAVRVLRQPASRGPSAARERAWRAGSAPLVAFLDDDCVPVPGWAGALLAAHAAAPGDVVLQGRVAPAPDELPALGPFSGTLWVKAAGPEFETANVAYPRALLARLGGFDPVFTKAAGEDTDLGWRAVAAGARPVFVPAALAHHAVHHLGPRGHLRRAARWDEVPLVHARHRGLRRHRVLGLFWKRPHWWLARALVALLLPRRGAWRVLRAGLAMPYVRWTCGYRTGPLLAPYRVLHDLVEVVTIVRGAVRYRVWML